MQYTTIKLECFRLYASDCLDRAEQAGVKVERLRAFLK
jgi:hypothetical protein